MLTTRWCPLNAGARSGQGAAVAVRRQLPACLAALDHAHVWLQVKSGCGCARLQSQARAGRTTGADSRAEGSPGSSIHEDEEEEDEDLEQQPALKNLKGSDSASPPRFTSSFHNIELSPSHPLYTPLLTDDDLESDPPGHKSGYVAVIGKPNAGKSTLINAFVGQKLSIVSYKPQTTRHRVVGITSDKDYQMILFDTPGIIANRRNKLEERMMAAVVSSVKNAEAIIAVVDSMDEPKSALAMFQPGKEWDGPPMAVLLNKADLLSAENLDELAQWYKENCRAEIVLTGSAQNNQGLDVLKQWAVSKLPEGPTLYPKDMVAEQPERFFVSEIIREQIFLQYDQEIPYCIQVQIKEFKERPNSKDYISAEILVERQSQVGIVVGKDGAALRVLGGQARQAIEEFLERKVYLELTVELAKNWREDTNSLKQFGYFDPLLI